MPEDTPSSSPLLDVLRRFENELLADWMAELARSLARRGDVLKESELRDMLAGMARARARRGLTPSETATFVFSFKQPLFGRLRETLGENPDTLLAQIWTATLLLDQLGLYTTEISQATREEVIVRQQQELMELSTPVVKLWDGILALPLPSGAWTATPAWRAATPP